MTHPRWIESAIKIGATLSVIAAFALVFTVVSTDGDVSSVSADVTDLVPKAVMQHGSFERVVEESGLEPRPYDMNGNLVNFAVGESNLSPTQLGDYYQQRLVQSGINSRVYDEGLSDNQHRLNETALEAIHQTKDGDADTKPAIKAQLNDKLPDDYDERTDQFSQQQHAMLNGEVVPLHMSDNRVTLAGIDPQTPTNELEDIYHSWQRDPISDELDLERNMDNFRFIEAYRAPGDRATTVNASWSDEDGDFDATKMSDLSGMEHDSEVKLPSCPGCERVQRLEGLHHDEPYTLNQFVARAAVRDVHTYYERLLGERGWTPADTDHVLDDLAYHVPELDEKNQGAKTFVRDGEFISLRAIQQDANTTRVVALHGDKHE